MGGVNTRGSIATERRASMIEYLQVLVLSNCILMVVHTHTVDILDLTDFEANIGIRANTGL